jgi:hypothetical protein
MNFLTILKIALSLLPIIHDAVDQVETLFPQGGKGAAKLEMVKSIIENTLAVSDSAGATMQVVWPVVSGMIAQIVSIKKLIG